ncbi:MAG: hypothetical protein A3F31_04050 [Candidatus Levybacteria bacterium RIFCSPHIGHO2_12_FULL_38_12]|nr:MAG: hypothetical protein A2770_02440 [Candidatus Levybacteria bacterium RIFCSPHIGHO2_01_FULL_38_12]OGH21937.1 MAG: hypothetical protein A3D75_00660 [Candidatus Levybacteria bacterium RIFCSPHIGHO2_02_FULL_37_18]OGH22869.1 MAG: hypothetical protein A3F31_04050 [Candidatus Levybacteria bacterium RIFCSPHIGHO2_12_FULL_38_12]OGH33594.1 MAG: hypothetical protein A3A47_02005 [Candidatus Levybacteria bacterium RIFCSPLOWO2_01_FULL_37_20]OGH44515.1 MAG: hypothetical protein A3J14_03695 [Candidatus Lev
MNIQTVNFNDASFVNVTNPSNLEIKYLKNNFGFDSLHLDDYIYKTQVPKIEIFKDYTLLVLDFPYFPQSEPLSGKNGEKNGVLSFPQFIPFEKKKRIFSSQVDFFIGNNYLVILYDGSLTPINYIFSQCQKTLRNREEYIGEGSVFLAYRIIDALVDSCFPVINTLSSTIDRIDRELEDKQSQNTLEEISTTRRNIVVFHTIIKPIIPLFKGLEEGVYKQLNGKMQPFWGNISDHLQKIMERVEDNRELLEGISESNESLLTSKTNEIVKVLTIYSAILLPLNLLASIYGMNIPGLPFAEDHVAFAIIMAFMFAIGVSMLTIFKFKRWF